MKTDNTITIREAQEKDASTVADWITHTKDNLFDAADVQSPSNVTFIAEDESGPLIAFPFKVSLTIESLAVKPGLDRRKAALVFAKFDEAITEIAKGYGMGEINWVCKDKSLIKFATAERPDGRGGYKQVEYPVLRKRLTYPKGDKTT